MISRRLRTGVVLIASFVVLGVAQGHAEASPAVEDETKKLHALFDDEWQWTLREYPEIRNPHRRPAIQRQADGPGGPGDRGT